MSGLLAPGAHRPPTAGLWEVPGQPHAVEALAGAAARGEVGHAWAFVGPADVGQEPAARSLAAALNCARGRGGVACGHCDVCERCLRGAYPAYWEFAPTGPVHRVDEVRGQWLHAAFRSAAEGAWKVLRILDADRMNDPAANAFLKGLEEPPERTVWLLDVTDPDELPDTVLSRCRLLRFAPLSAAQLDDAARRLGLDEPQQRRLAVRLSLGVPATLRHLAAPGGLEDLRAHRDIPSRLRQEGPRHALVAARALDEEVKRRTAAVAAQGKQELAGLAELYSGEAPRSVVRQLQERAARREREARTGVAQAALDDLVGWYRDVVLVAAGGDPAAALHADAAGQLRADAEALGPAQALRAIDLLLQTRERLELNVQQTLALEALLLDLSAMTLPG